ncbi:hypothetical protein ACFY8B_28780 [Streptomyces sp. NPDC012751]|uniref:hypothetical protein n=1 Tax=Streptomyces sp. NPDC012751 TaxID=3364846 RepID=UPI0036C3672E
MTRAFFSDAAEKILGDLGGSERTAVTSVRTSLAEHPAPGHARRLPDAGPRQPPGALRAPRPASLRGSANGPPA